MLNVQITRYSLTHDTAFSLHIKQRRSIIIEFGIHVY